MSATCASQAPAAFEPLCVQHMRVPAKKRDRTAGRSAPLRLPAAGLPDSGESPNLSTAGLHILFIISCELSVLCRFQLSPPFWPGDQHFQHVSVSLYSGQQDIPCVLYRWSTASLQLCSSMHVQRISMGCACLINDDS